MIIATFDIGTTAVKGVLTDDGGRILSALSEPVETIYAGEFKEQRPQDWYDSFCRISRHFLEAVPGNGISAVIMSGQMQDVIPVKKSGEPVGNAILYSDGRAEAEAQEILSAAGKEHVEKATGNHYDGSLSVPKILWLKRHLPDMYAQADAFLISAKDYILLRLTGEVAGDVVACSTAGGMDILEKKWDEKILECAGIEPEKLPRLYYPHERVGRLCARASAETGYGGETMVYAGTGDIGATTLASGITRPGEYNINLGTSGWVATISSEVFSAQGGVFNLAFLEKDLYINVVPFLNAANVHKWAAGLFAGQDARETDYENLDKILSQSTAGSHGVFFLPYLNGERFPVMDTEAKGSFLGITASTKKEDMARSCLEGVAFSIRQGIEQIGVPARSISVIGGGGRVRLWDQILADVLKEKVYVYKNSDILPALALAASVLVGEGINRSYTDFTASLQSDAQSVAFLPDPDNMQCYDKVYRDYLAVYPAVKTFYHRS